MIRQIVLLTAAASFVATASAQNSSKGSAPKEIRFIEGIEVGFGPNNNAAAAQPAKATPAVYTTEVPANTAKSSSPVRGTTAPAPKTLATVEDAGTLHLKFAVLLNTEVESVPALNLLVLMDDWWGTKYRLGGNDRNGIDCSGFTCMLYTQLFQQQLPRTAREQFQAARNIEPSQLREGDLVFFTTGGSITHVGFYLQNNKFVHASTSEGVTISDLNDRYWQARFAGAGRWEPGAAPLTNGAKP